MKYRYVLFDADETLFRFDIMAGLIRLFKQYHINFTQADFDYYQITNKQLWLDYQNGDIDAEYLQLRRFKHWSEKLNVSTDQLNNEFLDGMAKISTPLPGAISLLNRLHKHAKLGIITNGLARMQQKRLQQTGVEHLFDWLVISEVVGVAKPDILIYEHTFSLMDNPPKSEILMVGDNGVSDVIGGMNAGVDTCWLQHPGEKLPEGAEPTYQISHLTELTSILEI